MLHRLDIGDTIAGVFADTDGMEHLADLVVDRAEAMGKELRATGCITADPDSELDEAILTDCIDGSVWMPQFDDESPQAKSAAYRAISGAARAIEVFFGIEPGDIDVPTA